MALRAGPYRRHLALEVNKASREAERLFAAAGFLGALDKLAIMLRWLPPIVRAGAFPFEYLRQGICLRRDAAIMYGQ